MNVVVYVKVTHQIESLSPTAMQGLNGWNFTTDGTPGFLLMKIWSSNRVTPKTMRGMDKNVDQLEQV